MAKVDRRKSDWDVMEHVFGGVHATDDAGSPGAAFRHLELEAPMPEHDGPPTEGEQDLHHSHESDRRGEHKYPHKDKDDAERPSQKERDELVERLERRS